MKNLLILIVCSLLVSCEVIREIPVVETRIEYRDKFVHDSVNTSDSIFIYINGDTVYKYKERTLWKTRIERDTIVRTDSIPYPVYIDKVTTEYKTHWWQDILIGLGILFSILFAFRFRKIFGL